MRVWIETITRCKKAPTFMVTLYVRVWIETHRLHRGTGQQGVTLYVRVWIETVEYTTGSLADYCHPLREGVD